MALTSIVRAGALPNSAEKADLHSLIANAIISVSDIANADIVAAAAIADTKLATISTAGKVNTSALTTTSQAACDLLYSPEGTTWARLPKGSAGQKLRCRYGQSIVLCSHFDGADEATAYTDDIAGAYTFVNQAQLDTAQKKFGSASLLCDGSGDSATLPNSASWYFGTGDFTIDFWIRFAQVSTNQTAIMQYEDGTNYFIINFPHVSGTTYQAKMEFMDGTPKGVYWAVITLAADTWYHFAFVRNGTTGLIFMNGTSLSLSTGIAFGTNDVGDIEGTLGIGGASGNWLNGWIDEVRITKGLAQWTANFTAPTVAYPLIPTWEAA